jgi:hypothetical protein
LRRRTFGVVVTRVEQQSINLCPEVVQIEQQTFAPRRGSKEVGGAADYIGAAVLDPAPQNFTGSPL